MTQSQINNNVVSQPKLIWNCTNCNRISPYMCIFNAKIWYNVMVLLKRQIFCPQQLVLCIPRKMSIIHISG